MAEPSGKRRVLIAEDDVHTRVLLRELFEGWGFEAQLACDGQEAWDRLEPDASLLVLDLTMPKLDGFELLRRIRASPRLQHLPVMVLTAIGDVDGKLRGVELGADDYVTKPFRIAELQQRVEQVLDKSAYRAQSQAPADVASWEDSLTGLRERVDRELLRARQLGSPLCALLVAVDSYPVSFKSLSRKDVEALLGGLAELLGRGFRKQDVIHRIDSETFLVLVAAAPKEARGAAQRLLHAVREHREELKDLTVSAGLADRGDAERADDLIRAAHQALAEARRAGGGRVHSAAEPAVSATG